MRLLRVMALIDRAIGYVESATICLACAALFAMMILIFLDGSLRYALNSPLPFTVDLVTLYLISAAFLSVLSYTLRHGGHISVDLFAQMLPTRLYHLLIGAGLICALVVIGVMAIEVTGMAWESWHRNELLVGLYALPLWLSKAIVAVGLIILEGRLLHLGLSNVIAGTVGNPAFAVPIVPPADEPAEEAV